MRTLTIGLWLASLAALGVASLIAVQMGFMATSVDPIDLATNGLDPLRDALIAASGFIALGIATAIALRLWHSLRFRLVGLFLTLIDLGCVAGASVWFYREYF